MSSPEETLQQAQAHADVFDYEQAIDVLVKGSGLGPLLNAGLSHQPHLQSLHFFASIAIELGAVSEAATAYELAIETFPSDPNSYALLAPLVDDPQEALSLYLSALDKQSDVSSLSAAQLHCAIAEIWVTDFCMEPNADGEAEAHLVMASKDAAAKNDYEINYLFSQLYLNRDDRIKAIEYFEKMFDGLEINNSSFEVLLQAAKLGIELLQFETALGMLREAVEMKDDSPDVHYLLGLSTILSPSSSSLSLEGAEEHLRISKKEEFKDMLSHIDELLETYFNKDRPGGDNQADANVTDNGKKDNRMSEMDSN